MLETLTETLDLLVGDPGLVLYRRRAWIRPRTDRLLDWPDFRATDEKSLLDGLRRFLAESGVNSRAVRVCLAQRWVYSARIQPIRSAACLSDLQAYAELRLQQIYDLHGQPLVVDCMPSLSRSFMASALTSTLRNGLSTLLRETGLLLVSLVPESQRVLQHHEQQLQSSGDAVALVAGGRLRYALIDGGAADRWHQLSMLPSGLPLARIERDLLRHAELSALPVPQRLLLAAPDSCPLYPHELLSLKLVRLGKCADLRAILELS